MSGFLCNMFPGLPWCDPLPPDPEPPGPDPEPEPDPGDWRGELLYFHNEKRGPAKLALNHALNTCAQDYAEWMNRNNNLTHYNAGTGVGDRIRSTGYQWWTCGENIAQGYQGPAQVFQGWYSSSGHRRNILSSNFRECGFGESEFWWCAVYATASSQMGQMMLVARSQPIIAGGIRLATDPQFRALAEGSPNE